MRAETAVINPHACDLRVSKVIKAAGLVESDNDSERIFSCVAGVRYAESGVTVVRKTGSPDDPADVVAAAVAAVAEEGPALLLEDP